MNTQLLLLGFEQWLGVGGLIIAILALPISQWWKQKRTPSKIRKLKNEEQHRDEVMPNFHVYRSPGNASSKFIHLKNEGSKAFGIILSGILTQIPFSLKLDKLEAEKGEVVSVFLGDGFYLLPNEKMHIVVGYADIEGRRYQQSYSRTNNESEITTPQLLLTRK
jgi:hypothetical protein